MICFGFWTHDILSKTQSVEAHNKSEPNPSDQDPFQSKSLPRTWVSNENSKNLQCPKIWKSKVSRILRIAGGRTPAIFISWRRLQGTKTAEKTHDILSFGHVHFPETSSGNISQRRLPETSPTDVSRRRLWRRFLDTCPRDDSWSRLSEKSLETSPGDVCNSYFVGRPCPLG